MKEQIEQNMEVIDWLAAALSRSDKTIQSLSVQLELKDEDIKQLKESNKKVAKFYKGWYQLEKERRLALEREL